MALKIQSTMVPEGDFPAVEAKDVLLPDGKRLPEALEGLGEGTVKSVNGTLPDEDGNIEIEIAEEPLTGSTAEVTPTQVAEAVAEGRPIILTYTDSFYGNVVLSNFGRVDGLNLVTASTVVEVVDELFSATLTGDTGYNTWAYKFERIVRNAELDELETLPEVTAEDNGKFLGVVNGAWAAVTVFNAEDTSF